MLGISHGPWHFDSISGRVSQCFREASVLQKQNLSIFYSWIPPESIFINHYPPISFNRSYCSNFQQLIRWKVDPAADWVLQTKFSIFQLLATFLCSLAEGPNLVYVDTHAFILTTYTYIHTLHYITLHYTTLHYITLHYITLHTYTCVCVLYASLNIYI